MNTYAHAAAHALSDPCLAMMAAEGDWDEVEATISAQLAGLSRTATYEADRSHKVEAEPIIQKSIARR